MFVIKTFSLPCVGHQYWRKFGIPEDLDRRKSHLKHKLTKSRLLPPTCQQVRITSWSVWEQMWHPTAGDCTQQNECKILFQLLKCSTGCINGHCRTQMAHEPLLRHLPWSQTFTPWLFLHILASHSRTMYIAIEVNNTTFHE